MKVFTVDQYMDLDEAKKAIIDEWIQKYDLETVALLMSKPVADDLDHLVAYGVIFYDEYREGVKVLSAPYEEFPSCYVKVAEFDNDDFPWEVLN